MKRCILALICLISIQLLVAQTTYYSIIEQHNPNKEWTIDFSSIAGSIIHKTYFGEQISIQNKIYTEVYYKTSGSESVFGYLLEEEQKIYLKTPFSDQTLLLYDFSLQKGDIIELPFLLGQTTSLKVAEVNQVVINGVERKQLTLQGDISVYNDEIIWIEGLGSTHGLLDNGLQGGYDAISTLLSVNTKRQNLYCNSDYSSAEQYCVPTEEQSEITATTPILAQPNTFQFQAQPNIFAQTTTLQFVLPENGIVNLHIYNTQGQKVKTLFSNEILNRGQHQKTLQLDNVPYGVYYAVLSSNGIAIGVHKTIKIAR